jgi:hypothetical protein
VTASIRILEVKPFLTGVLLLNVMFLTIPIVLLVTTTRGALTTFTAFLVGKHIGRITVINIEILIIHFHFYLLIVWLPPKK